MECMHWLIIVLCIANYFLRGCCVNGSELLIQNDLEYYETLNYNLEKSIAASEPINRRKRDASHTKTESSVGTERSKISFFAFGQQFRLQLKRDFSIFHNNIKIQFGESQHVKLSHDTMNLYDGPVVTSSSSLKGYCFGSISNGIFDGQILTQEGTYYVTRLPFKSMNESNNTGHSIIYHEKHVKQLEEPHTCGITEPVQKWMNKVTAPIDHEIENATEIRPTEETLDTKGSSDYKIRQDKIQMSIAESESVLKSSQRYRQKRQTVESNKNSNIKVCALYIRTDGMLWSAIRRQEGTQNDMDTKIKITELIHKHVKKLNFIMQSHNFDSPNVEKVVFKIARLKILSDVECKPFCDKNLDSSAYLNIQSEDDHSAYCLAYAFTYRDWTGGTLGVAWVAKPGSVGGICETHRSTSFLGGKRSLNTGVVTLQNSGRRIPMPKSELTFAHEIGHNLGSPHDTCTGLTCECLPSNGGNYLMYAYSNSGNQRNNAKFSPCSRGNISSVLTKKKLSCKGFEVFSGSFCGNAILDEGNNCEGLLLNINLFTYISILSF